MLWNQKILNKLKKSEKYPPPPPPPSYHLFGMQKGILSNVLHVQPGIAEFLS